MTNEQYKVKEYLSGLRQIEIAISIKLDKIEELEALATRISTVYEHERVQGGYKKKVVEDTAIKVAMFTEQLRTDVDEYRTKIMRVKDLIKILEDPIERNIMEMRYINFMKWENICDKLGYVRQHINRMHTTALSRIAKSSNWKHL